MLLTKFRLGILISIGQPTRPASTFIGTEWQYRDQVGLTGLMAISRINHQVTPGRRNELSDS
jgi:hypothetical protein